MFLSLSHWNGCFVDSFKYFFCAEFPPWEKRETSCSFPYDADEKERNRHSFFAKINALSREYISDFHIRACKTNGFPLFLKKSFMFLAPRRRRRKELACLSLFWRRRYAYLPVYKRRACPTKRSCLQNLIFFWKTGMFFP